MGNADWNLVLRTEGRAEMLRFQLEMIKERAGKGWTHQDLRKALMGQGRPINPESGSLAWRMSDVQLWCRLLDGSLAIQFPRVPKPDKSELDQLMGNLAALFDKETFERWSAVRYLAAARIKAGVSVSEMALRTGIGKTSVAGWENNTDNPMIPGLYRHARALGGTIRLDFVPNKEK